MIHWPAWRRLTAHLPSLGSPGPATDGAVTDAVFVAGACGVLALLLTWQQGYHAFFDALNAAWISVPPTLTEAITYAGDTLPALALLLIFARRAPRMLWLATLAAVIATLLSNGLKQAVGSLRPAAVLPPGSFHLLGPAYQTHSFPSGHAITAFVAAAALGWYLRWRPLRIGLYLLAAVVAWSRVGVGAHWPVDALAGAALGTLSVLIAANITPYWRWGLRRSGHLLLVGVLVGCDIWLLRRQPVYPLATLPAHALAALALLVAATQQLRALFVPGIPNPREPW